MTRTWLAVAAALGFSSAAGAQVGYSIEPGGTFTKYDCLPPCACPPTQTAGALTGTFTLVFDHADPTFRYYNVLAVSWVAVVNGVPTPITGSGTYKIAIPISWYHRLELDLQVGSEPVRHFDSGDVGVGVHNQFPSIQVIAATEQFGCEKQEFDIIASPAPVTCYANCDGSSAPPVLNVNDFQCFLNSFAAGGSYANCDNSTLPPVLNVNDFSCFINAYAAGCP